MRVKQDDVRYLQQAATAETLPEALARLNSADTETQNGSVSPTEPFWLEVSLPRAPTKGVSHLLEIRCLRALSAEFWASTSGGPPAPLSWREEKGGIVVDLPATSFDSTKVFGKITAPTVYTPKYAVWKAEQYIRSAYLFERTGGALTGALLMLVLFSAMIAALNRDTTYLLFAAWLTTGLRVAAINNGWDFRWLGIDLSADTLTLVSKVTLAAHALFTTALFSSLLASELQRTGAQHRLSVVVAYFSVLTLAAAVLPWHVFLPTFWASSVVGMLYLLYELKRILQTARSSTAMWYAASWGIMFAGMILEVLVTTDAIRLPIQGVSAQGTSLANALLTAVALADRIRAERNGKITAQRREIAALKQLHKTFQSVPSGLFSLDQLGKLRSFNAAFSAVFPDKTLNANTHWEQLFGSGSFETLKARCAASVGERYELSINDHSGTRRILGIQAAIENGEVEGSIVDLTAQKTAEARLQFLANNDPLTGLLNRRGFDAALEAALKATAGGEAVAMAYVDLDRFKLVNDLFGHAAGDSVLQQVAERIQNALPPGATTSRVGGDEFIVIFPDTTIETAEAICADLLARLRERAYTYADKAFSIDGSCGVIPLTAKMNAREAVTTCDRTCAEAKRLGGSRVVALREASASLKAHMDEIRLVAGMKTDLPVDRLFTLFQPIVSLSSPQKSLCYEVLIRMRDTDGQIISPARFVAAAERNGVITKIDLWVLESTLKWLRDHDEHRRRVNFVTVNLSGASLNDERFLEAALTLVENYPEAVRKLCFEITESVALYDIENTRRFVTALQRHGAKVALDDFGAGYTSFNYLKDISSDLVKIDGSFVRDINKHPHNLAITRAIVDLAHELGMECIAEWAEDDATLEVLARLGVDYAQGYGLCMPIPNDDVLHARSGFDLVPDEDTRAMLRRCDEMAPTSRGQPTSSVFSETAA